MATFRYLVTVELSASSTLTATDIENEIDSNLESVITSHDIHDFTVELLPDPAAYPGQHFTTFNDIGLLSPDSRYQS